MEDLKKSIIEASKDKSAEEIKVLIAQALSSAFFFASKLATVGDPFSGIIQTQIIALAEQFPAGREAANSLRADMGVLQVRGGGVGGGVVRKGPTPYTPGAKKANIVVIEEEEKEVGKLVAPSYVAINQSGKDDDPPCCGEEDGKDLSEDEAIDLILANNQTPVDIPGIEDLPKNILLDPENGEKVKLTRDQLFETTAEHLQGAFSQKELLHIIQAINGEVSGARSKAAIAKRIMIRVNQIKRNA